MIAALLLPGTAHAQTFAPINCGSTCVTVPFPYSSANSGNDALPQDLNSAGMANNVEMWRTIAANQYARLMDIHMVSATLESGHDSDTFYNNGNSKIFSGSYTNYTAFLPTSQYNLQTNPYVSVLVTDSSNTSTFQFDQVDVCCNTATGSSPAALIPKERAMGVLIGSHDTIYYSIGSAPTGQTLNLAMWGREDTTPSYDFDLYARCNAQPTTTTYYARDFRQGPQGFLRLPAAACPGGTWSIAINSYNGLGMYNLLATYGDPGPRTITVSAGVCLTSAQITSLATTVKQANALFYGTTDGIYWNDTLNFYSWCTTPFTGITPNVVIRNDCSRSYTPGGGGAVQLCTGGWGNPRVLAHEFGHALMGLPDEYQDVGTLSMQRCGHTMMAGILNWNNDYCTTNNANHNLDPLSGYSPTGYTSGNWDNVYLGPSWGYPIGFGMPTPDPYSFLDFSHNSGSTNIYQNP